MMQETDRIPGGLIGELMREDRSTGLPGENAYAMGYSDVFTELLQRRSAELNAAHLLPLLEPGMHILDLGCGPGSITIGLALAVSPGRATGLDLNGKQVRMARNAARRTGASNTAFIQGDALRMEFPQDHFDAVHCHGFLMHSSISPGSARRDNAGPQARGNPQRQGHGRPVQLHIALPGTAEQSSACSPRSSGWRGQTPSWDGTARPS